MQRKSAARVPRGAIAMSATLAGTADAATTTLRLHTQADTTKFMSDSGFRDRHAWPRTTRADANAEVGAARRARVLLGYATYLNLERRELPAACTGRGPPTASRSSTAEKCVSGAC